MTFNRGNRRIAALAAAFAILLQTLWPLLSHARPKDPSLLVPVCTVDGVTHYLEIKTGETTPLEERSSTHDEHCKLCVFESARDVAVPGSNDFLSVSSISEDSQIISRPVSSVRPAGHYPARPRAPPQSS